ncbi:MULTISPECIES: lipid A 3-O-deacylase [Dyella]|uniref:Lipid A 3-O-deacylase n=2 Tax=Dyella TaxID=231454 RepID=A0A4R0YRK9_9GAMM|nr:MULTISPECIES: lipid A 3-O-deacylase [Dyella]TBR35940.1 lipid A 3-O-deacylase [Dyella terrae]TCI08513.1 lipid A 3-O-deacylase [Dyella soli]
MRYPRLLRSALAFAFIPFAAVASAAHVEVQGGRSYMDSYGANTAFVEAVFADRPIGDSHWTWAPDVSMGWINGRSTHRYDGSGYDAHDNVALFAGGARFRYGSDSDWYHGFFYSLQGAVQTGRTQALSSIGEFVNTVGWQGKHVSFQIRHISNGGTHGPNRGETMALVGVGFGM